MSADDSSRAAAPADAGATPAPRRRRRRVALWLGSALAVVATAAMLVIGTAMWSLHHASGSAWLLGLVPRLTVIEPRGSLIGDFAAKQVVYAIAGVGELHLDAPRWHALAAVRGSDGRWLHLVIDTLHADRAVWTPAKTAAPGG